MKNRHAEWLIKHLIWGMVIFLGNFILAQTGDSLQAGDSLKVLPESKSSAKSTPASARALEGPIKYWAEKISFSISREIVYLEGNVRLQYQDVDLTAGKVTIEWPKNRMLAEGITDSSDSQGNAIYRATPILTEKGMDPIEGFKLEYNFKNQRGKILKGKTKIQPGFYRGKDIRKIGKETLFIKNGYFTTCDLDHPHYYFKCSQMRVRLKKQAVVRPVVLYVADVPIIPLPFWIFPLKRGRRSGIVIPKYEDNFIGGRTLRDFGYYFAPSDYWDIALLSSFYENIGMLYNSRIHYHKRYTLSGDIAGSYSPKDRSSGKRIRRWWLDFNHQQTIGQTLKITGSGEFFSDKNFSKDYSSKYQDRLKNNLNTRLSLTKSLPGGRRLIMNLQRNENLLSGKKDLTFPDIRFTQPQKRFIPLKSDQKNAWYHQLRYNYESRLTAKMTADSARLNITRKNGWEHKLSSGFNFNMFKYITFNYSTAFDALWVPHYLEYADFSAQPDTIKAFRARHTYRNSVAMNTRLYGILNMSFSPLKAIRHELRPEIGFSYSPDFSDTRFGYYQHVLDSTGKVIRRDRFAENPFTATPKYKQANINFKVENRFQGKWEDKSQEKKINFFRNSFSTSYNMAADTLNWSDLSTTFNAKPHQNLTLNLNARHSFYQKQAQTTINKFVWADGFRLPRLLNWQVNLSSNFRLSPRTKTEETKEETAAPGDSLANIPEVPETEDDFLTPEQQKFKKANIPWNLNLGIDYSYSEQETRISRNFNSRISGSLNLTPNWEIHYNANVDLLKGDLNNQTFSIHRNLHCWKMEFTWSPTPQYSFYRLEIRVDESLLRDLKITKTAGAIRRSLF